MRKYKMYMFLPFLLALITGISILLNKRTASYLLWSLLLIVTLLSFMHHVTDPLTLSF